ncbi:hypothetical protein Pmani_007298 [Petrolisthes manimaculis]|uniref:Uncharacterized protein n=1 Tax=Petrolisthes manimaculis TaxID=1843537 RepID=A0AAE1Q8M5_9EUCA|nr:hypothetical protein Pmani_007298 [Petrolisthes manimaculis]
MLSVFFTRTTHARAMDKRQAAHVTYAIDLVVNPLGDRIIDAFFEESKSDCVNLREFVRVLVRFRPIQPG